MTFDDGCQIVAIHCDRLTRFPSSIPIPSWLEDEEQAYHRPDDVKVRIGKRSADFSPADVSHGFSKDLLERVLRYRPFWLRLDLDNADPHGRYILQHPEWGDLLDHLRKNDLIRFDDAVPAGGPLAPFIHFRLDDIKAHFGI